MAGVSCGANGEGGETKVTGPSIRDGTGRSVCGGAVAPLRGNRGRHAGHARELPEARTDWRCAGELGSEFGRCPDRQLFGSDARQTGAVLQECEPSSHV